VGEGVTVAPKRRVFHVPGPTRYAATMVFRDPAQACNAPSQNATAGDQPSRTQLGLMEKLRQIIEGILRLLYLADFLEVSFYKG
jgi:hypothetical protein